MSSPPIWHILSLRTYVYEDDLPCIESSCTIYPDASSYEFQAKLSSSSTWVSNGFSAIRSVIWTGLSWNTRYDFRVRCNNTDWDTVKSITTGSNPFPEMAASYAPPYYPQVTDQLGYSTCVAHALATLKEIHEYIEGKGSHNSYSITWIYGNRKSTDRQTEGMQYLQALENLRVDGVPKWNEIPNNWWPDVRDYPSSKAIVTQYKDSLLESARMQRIASYEEIHSATFLAMGERIKQDGGFLIALAMYYNGNYNYWDSETSGYCSLSMPSTYDNDEHMVVAIGWKTVNGQRYWICANSWGTGWGDNGKLYIPFEAPYYTAYFYVTDGQYSAKLDTPTLSYSLSEQGGFTVVINSIAHASGYYINLFEVTNGVEYGISVWSQTSTSIHCTGLKGNQTYKVVVQATGAGYIDSDYAIFYMTTQQVAAPQPPALQGTYVASNSITAVWYKSTSSNVNSYWLYIRISGEQQFTYVGSLTATSAATFSYTFNNLEPSTTYDIGIIASFSGTVFSETNIRYGLTTLPATPNSFEWDTPKIPFQEFVLSANEWNRLISVIKAVYAFNSWSTDEYYLPDVWPSCPVYAGLFNEVKNAINSKNYTGIADKAAGEPIKANDLNILRDKINEIS